MGKSNNSRYWCRFNSFDNRLNFTGDIYRRNTKDMLTLGEVLPGVLGANLLKENLQI